MTAINTDLSVVINAKNVLKIIFSELKNDFIV